MLFEMNSLCKKLPIIWFLIAVFSCFFICKTESDLRTRINVRDFSEEVERNKLHQDSDSNCFRCKKNLTIAVLAPKNDSLPYSLNKILPSIIYAVRSAQNQFKLNGYSNSSINILYRDTGCSSTSGPLAAFDFFIKGAADVFFGPLCPYVLAPVARYTTVWNIPLLTSGGQNDNFDFKYPHYSLLTRMNGAYSQIGLILLQILQKFRWHVVGLLYHNFDDRTKGNSNCFFTLGAVFAKLGSRPFHRAFDETNPETDYKAILDEVAKSSRSKISKLISLFYGRFLPPFNLHLFGLF